jgi:hypothetical protein
VCDGSLRHRSGSTSRLSPSSGVRWLLALLAGGAPEARPDETARLLGPYYGSPVGFLRMVGFWSRRVGVFEMAEASCDAEGALA